LRYYGYTMVSINNEANVANVLEQVLDCLYYWRHILNGLLQARAIQQDLVLKDVSEEQNMVETGAMGIFWDFDSMGLSMNLQHETSNFRTEQTRNALHSRPRFL
nr:hypothetical protein [Tanacetum cinerariifolium]